MKITLKYQFLIKIINDSFKKISYNILRERREDMKFRFRADPEDLLIFAVFAGFLFFIIALIVSNLHTMASSGELAGLNPFPAFAPDMILSTLALYFLVL